MFGKKLSTVVLLTLFFVACKQQIAESEVKPYSVNQDTVIITSSTLSNEIVVSKVELKSYVKEVITSGTVQAIPTQFAYVAPPFSGRVVKSYISLGQSVKAYTPLFEITSPEFTSTQKEFFQAQSELILAQKELQRKQDLIRNGVGSQKELDEAQNVLLIAEKEYENIKAALEVYQTDINNMVHGQPLVVRAPISGEVIANNIITGQYITSDSDPVAIVADLSKVWIVAQVKEKDIRFIHEGDEMDINIAAFPGKSIKGKVFHVDKAVDEETRSIKVLSICENKDRLLKLGMYTTVHFLDKPADCIVISEKALLQEENNSFVFVQKAPNKYVRTAVEVEGVGNNEVIVMEGLTVSDRIISEGGYYLK